MFANDDFYGVRHDMKLVLANGCFDLLHIGHIRHLEEARSMGDYLVVGVTVDECVGKGPGRPVETLDERMAKLRALRCVSGVTACESGVQALAQWHPTIFVKGHEYEKKGLVKAEVDFCTKHGIKIAYTAPSEYSTGKIIQRIKA